MNEKKKYPKNETSKVTFGFPVKREIPAPQRLFLVTTYDINQKKLDCPNVPFVTIKKINIENTKSRSLKLVNEFCDYTTIVGLRYLGGTRRARNIFWWLWFILWLSQVVLCAWLSSKLFIRYLDYHIKTSSTYYNVEELPFPAITICNQNTFRKAVVGGSMPVMYYIAAFFAKNQKQLFDLMYEVMKQNNQTCYKEPDPKIADKMAAAGRRSFTEAMHLAASDSRSDVVKCWWNSGEINCSGIFLNHATDYSWCYTFNPDQLVASGGDKNVAENVNFNGYGLDAKNYFLRKLRNAGPRNGLRLLMNANQPDYCGSGRKYNGAGFYVQVHDPAVQASFLNTKSILLAPGYKYDISFKPITFQRETEHLGKCLNRLHLWMYPNVEIYFQMACLLQSMTEAIWKTCNCLPFTAMGQKELLAKHFRVKTEDTHFCGADGLICLRNWLEKAFSQSVDENFPSCKVPCTETFYEIELSAKRFPHRHRFDDMFNDTTSKNVSMERNYLQVNFYFDSMNKLTIVEYQAFSMVGLTTAFGWTMNLFLGSSFITPFEPLSYVLLYITETIKTFRYRNRVTKIRKTVMQTYF